MSDVKDILGVSRDGGEAAPKPKPKPAGFKKPKGTIFNPRDLSSNLDLFAILLETETSLWILKRKFTVPDWACTLPFVVSTKTSTDFVSWM